MARIPFPSECSWTDSSTGSYDSGESTNNIAQGMHQPLSMAERKNRTTGRDLYRRL
ncbi:hypothetical protein CCACVL1_28754 [Corchorus capsularis]|uniref:Uncharacterized protein n=1 Tax=Corchorus capsularis TaxID=210143 RepID=A0A1R3G5E4_COCAP|nr:hypothetical protein CCACVL1_28754 [Corchorus capsularis]